MPKIRWILYYHIFPFLFPFLDGPATPFFHPWLGGLLDQLFASRSDSWPKPFGLFPMGWDFTLCGPRLVIASHSFPVSGFGLVNMNLSQAFCPPSEMGWKFVHFFP